MAASLGLCFPPDDLVVANNCAAAMHFLPSAIAVAADDFCPKLGVHPPPDYYYSPPQQVFAGNEMNMRFADDGRMTTTMRMSRAAGTGTGSRPSPSRIGFRTRSKVDVLDDGFRWRKYGKKAVKSSPNPRNYYRCSVEGCGVKKRVERDCDDPRYVVTTYDGVHNHAAGRRQALAPYGAAATSACAPAGLAAGALPSDMWGGVQVHAAAARSSESSY